MKFEIKKSDLYRHISIAQKAISTKSSIQILEGIVFKTINDELILSSTDMELSIKTKVKCKVLEEGNAVIKSSLIGNIINKMPDDNILITVSNDNCNIRCQNSVFDIPCLQTYEYPQIPNIDDEPILRVENSDLIEAIKETSFATSLDETRLALTGIFFEYGKEKLNFVALDGYRLALKSLRYSSEDSGACIVPKRAFMELSKIIQDGEYTDIVVINGHIVFNTGSTKMYSRLIDKAYIDYQRLLESSTNILLKVNKKELESSLERAQLLSSSSTNITKLVIEDGVININSNSDYGKLDEKIFCESLGDEKDIVTGFNTKLLLDGIKVINQERIELRLTKAERPMPMLITPEDETDNYLYLILPVRLSN